MSVSICRSYSEWESSSCAGFEFKSFCCLQAIYCFLAYCSFCLFLKVFSCFHFSIRLLEYMLIVDYWLISFYLGPEFCCSRRGTKGCGLNWKSFCLISLLSLIGLVAYHSCFPNMSFLLFHSYISFGNMMLCLVF